MGGPEFAVLCDSLPRVCPHVADVQVCLAIVIVVEPGGAHSRANIFQTRARCGITKAAPFVDVEVLPPEIICYIQVGPTVVVEIAPSGCKAESVIVFVHSGFSR